MLGYYFMIASYVAAIADQAMRGGEFLDFIVHATPLSLPK
jgi:hypothetical protein